MRTLTSPLKAFMRFCFTTWAKYIAYPAVMLLFTAGSVCAQTDFISPYSIFGPGVIYPRQGVWQSGMGGSGSALFDLYRLNLTNPAVSANHAEPIFEIGGRQVFTTYTSDVDMEEGTAFKVNNISLAFPIKRNAWNFGLGVVPFSEVGYEVTGSAQDVNLGLDYQVDYKGEGGISQAYINLAGKLIDKVDSANNVQVFSIGANLNYNFGNIINDRRLFFPDDLTILGFRNTEQILIRDINADFGIHFHTNIIKRTNNRQRYLKLLTSATYSLASNLNSELTGTAYSYRPNASGASTSAQDTIVSNSRLKGEFYLPSSYSFGVGLDYLNDKKQRFRMALDYRSQQWSEYTSSFSSEYLQFQFRDSKTLSGGLEFTPNVLSQNLFERMEYRVGFRSEQSKLYLRDTPIDDFGMSFGLSLPIHYRRGTTFSTLNISTEYGNRGTTDNGLIREEYLRVFVGFTLTPNYRNRWFVKPKYD